ncbi:hypothetical protein ACFX4N_23915 [Priestia sp. YIM B13551]|uniref:hypothetical protein n=1 Tax=Priestia sp. YIM B13551 TaxID=3366306 RepID=UPI0036702F7A
MKKIMGFIKRRWSYIVVAIIALIIGGAGGPSQDEYDKLKDKNIELTGETVLQQDKIDELQEKIDKAAPLFELSDTEIANKTKEAEAKQAELDKQAEAKQAEEEKKQEAEAAAALAEKAKTFTAGKYIVGRDIDAGTYDVKATSGQGNFSVQNSYDLKVNEMFGVGDSQYYNDQVKNVELEDGDEIELNNGLRVNFTPIQ